MPKLDEGIDNCNEHTSASCSVQAYAPSFVESQVQTCPTLSYDQEVQTCIISENS